MTQPTAYTGRPVTPAPGAEARELRVARVRGHARRLFWCAAVLVVASAAVGYFTGNLPAPFEDWMLWAAAGLVVLLLVVVPFLRWFARTYTVTTRRVVAQSGVLRRTRTEIGHARGYTISERRGPIQRMWGAGTLTLSNGVDAPLRMVDIPSVRLMNEALADQVEVSQILAHRDSHVMPIVPGPPPPLPTDL
ncbi:MAG: PH domain-containing protein [Microbacterium sp.]|uniref:PH domain-containing protein n=1 Tax=Microbacterium sp. TaxID=51671 RepID=UPI001AD546A3|nr:PH domain-containing protein [Microbacterium sp.]MBN9178748.1 PH domain-containing protein [Microbacterium sp.]